MHAQVSRYNPVNRISCRAKRHKERESNKTNQRVERLPLSPLSLSLSLSIDPGGKILGSDEHDPPLLSLFNRGADFGCSTPSLSYPFLFSDDQRADKSRTQRKKEQAASVTLSAHMAGYVFTYCTVDMKEPAKAIKTHLT